MAAERTRRRWLARLASAASLVAVFTTSEQDGAVGGAVIINTVQRHQGIEQEKLGAEAVAGRCEAAPSAGRQLSDRPDTTQDPPS